MNIQLFHYDFCILVLCKTLKRHECTKMKNSLCYYSNYVYTFNNLKMLLASSYKSSVIIHETILHTKLLWYSQYDELVFKCEQN